MHDGLVPQEGRGDEEHVAIGPESPAIGVMQSEASEVEQVDAHEITISLKIQSTRTPMSDVPCARATTTAPECTVDTSARAITMTHTDTASNPLRQRVRLVDEPRAG